MVVEGRKESGHDATFHSLYIVGISKNTTFPSLECTTSDHNHIAGVCLFVYVDGNGKGGHLFEVMGGTLLIPPNRI